VEELGEERRLGEVLGSALTPGPLQHGVCSTGCRRSDILAESDHAAKAEVDHLLTSVSEKKRHAETRPAPQESPLELVREAGAQVFLTP
jgi:hypothetical protein